MALSALSVVMAGSAALALAAETNSPSRMQPDESPMFAATDIPFGTYLRTFDYAERDAMKIKTAELLELVRLGKVQVIDIRFPEEVSAWRVSFAKNIPLNELPDRLNELDRDKLIVPVCPHYDRASIARHYLTLKGYRSRSLSDGLLGLTEYLRGDKAKDFIDALKHQSEIKQDNL